LDRIAAVNPKVNAIVTLMADEALTGADAADKAVKDGAELGPFHGVPFTIKDAIDTAGVLTQRGSRIFAGNIPTKDATVVTRFKAAGAIPLAKTNLPVVPVAASQRQSPQASRPSVSAAMLLSPCEALPH
jgi:aspartyl-tRNA(Asn)/glutamyl-tRNA(Gln) amidotransferase subunit A